MCHHEMHVLHGMHFTSLSSHLRCSKLYQRVMPSIGYLNWNPNTTTNSIFDSFSILNLESHGRCIGQFRHRSAQSSALWAASKFTDKYFESYKS